MARNAESKSTRFILAALTHRFGDGRGAALLSDLAGEIPPGEAGGLAEDASYHEIEPLLHAIASDCSDAGYPLPLPPGLLARLAHVHAGEMLRTTVIHFGAVRALAALGDAGVRAVPLKGYYLASRFYERKDARAFKDLDLLVEPGSLADLNRALLDAGFQPAPHRPAFVPAPAYTVYTLLMEGGDMVMEIDVHIGMHWPREYESRTGFRPEDLWSSAVSEELEGMQVWALKPEHLVATTVLDAAVNHRYARLVKFRDVLEIARGTEVDWDEVADCCGRWGVRSFVGPGLRFMSEIDPSLPIPSEVLDSLLPSYPAMRAFLRALPLAALPGHRSRSFSLPNLLFFLLADTPRERARGLLHIPRHMFRGRRRF